MAKFDLCFLFFLSFLFSSCSHTPMNTEEARAYLLDAQQHIERIRENNRHRYARELEKSERMLTARQTHAPLADLNALKKTSHDLRSRDCRGYAAVSSRSGTPGL